MSLSKDVLLNKYAPFNIPVPYKDWDIYQVKLKDYYDVNIMLSLFEVDKNTLGQIEFISMSNLRFILLVSYSNEEYLTCFDKLLRVCLNISDDEVIKICMTDSSEYLSIGIPIGVTKGGDFIMDDKTAKIITSEDFDEIKRIILFQNVLDYTDEYIDPDVKRATDEYYRLKNKGIRVSLEHKIICVQMRTGMTTEAIGDLTIRNFQQLFDVIAEESDYNSLRIAEANGAKFKTPVTHWAYKERKDKYASAFCDADAFTDMVQSAN